MAAVSQTATTFTSSSNGQGTGYSWDIQPEGPLDDNTVADDENAYQSRHTSLTSQNRHPNSITDAGPRNQNHGEPRSEMRGRNTESGHLPPHHLREPKAKGVNENLSPADSLLDLYDGPKERSADDANKRAASEMTRDPEEDDNNWIHRDKLAKIESEELQAAGIFLPRARDRARSKSQNRPKRDQSQDKANGHGRTSDHQPAARSRKNSAVTGDLYTPSLTSVPSWDLRCPDEIAEDAYFTSNGTIKGSRIPLAKTSPVPIPSEHLERETILIRKRETSPANEDSISYPKPRARSGSTGNALSKPSSNGTHTTPSGKRVDSSPKKTGTGPRKPSGLKAANGGPGRPKTRGGPSKDSTGPGGARPTTRSGELSPSSSKQMEGEPPWMVSAYRPDPRLPPDQQLLPTVAKRLQQEKWEREGKFGTVYDKEFRPLTDEGFLKRPEVEPVMTDQDNEKDAREDDQADWPLKPESKSPSLPGRTNSYSTMPRISDKSAMSPVPRPRTPSQPPPLAATRIPEPPEEPSEKKSAGCGCCIVM